MACITNINFTIEGQVEDEQYELLEAELTLITARYRLILENNLY